MANETVSRLVGTFQSAFRIGAKGSQIRLKNNSGILDIRDNGDAAYVGVKALTTDALQLQPTDLSVAYTIPANRQSIWIGGFTISTGGSLTVDGEYHIRS